jgi:hypothetical protein
MHGTAVVTDISVSGARLSDVEALTMHPGDKGYLLIDNMPPLAFASIASVPGTMRIRFDLDQPAQSKLDRFIDELRDAIHSRAA